jgi:hypothetical protein
VINTMTDINHISELFIFEERDFITAAYRALLRRDPDPVGMNYYIGRMRMGYGKAAIIVQLATSKEAHPTSQINGLDNLIKEERRATHWFWGLLTHHQRAEKLMHQQVEEPKHLNNRIAQQSTQVTQPNITCNTPNESIQQAPAILPTTPDDLNQLTPRARDIYFQLKEKVKRQTGGIE